MIDSTNPRVMADNIRALSDKQIAEAAEIVALQGDIEALGTYSTTEVDTGMVDPDGNSIKRVVVKSTCPDVATTGTGVERAIEFTEVAKIYRLEGYIYGASNAIFASPYYKDSGYGVKVFYRNGNLNIRSTDTDFNGKDCEIIIEYTKSATPAPDVLPSPDTDTRTLEEPEPEPEPIEEKK